MNDLDFDVPARVLVADDADGLVAVVMQALLEPMGCEVETVDDAADIAPRLRRGGYAALVAERGRTIDGLALARALGEIPDLPRVPILLVGETIDTIGMAHAFSAGVRGHLSTPLRLGEVVDALTDCMASPAA
ncbi:MAG: hypothetical protein H6704_11660 [Myxococcales bacterium]|nr:hypothetical protein [Myxococcales bacterium]